MSTLQKMQIKYVSVSIVSRSDKQIFFNYVACFLESGTSPSQRGPAPRNYCDLLYIYAYVYVVTHSHYIYSDRRGDQTSSEENSYKICDTNGDERSICGKTLLTLLSPINRYCPNSRKGACSQCSTLTQVGAAFGVYWVVCSLQDSSSLKTQRLRRRRALQTVVAVYYQINTRSLSVSLTGIYQYCIRRIAVGRAY